MNLVPNRTSPQQLMQQLESARARTSTKIKCESYNVMERKRVSVGVS